MTPVQPNPSSSGRVRRGFTLVEILATMTLAAIVLPPVLHGISLCLATAGEARQQAQAAALGHGKLSEIVAAGQLDHLTPSGDFGADWPGYRWTASVGDWDSGWKLQQVDVTVTWRQAGRDRSVTVTTMVYLGGAS